MQLDSSGHMAKYAHMEIKMLVQYILSHHHHLFR